MSKKISKQLEASLDQDIAAGKSLKSTNFPDTERFCCNPKCKYHENYVHKDTDSMQHMSDTSMQAKVVIRYLVTRSIEGIEISGKFCQVCYEVIHMFKL